MVIGVRRDCFAGIFDKAEHSFGSLVGGFFAEAIFNMRQGFLLFALMIQCKAEVVAGTCIVGRDADGVSEIVLCLREKTGVYADSTESVEGIGIFGVKFQNPLID